VSDTSYEKATSAEIKADIDQTRERMDQTLEQLGERLHPRHLLEDVLDYFKSADPKSGQRIKQAAGKAGRVLVHQIQQHPLPCLLVGAGVTWMAVQKKNKYFPPDYSEPGEYVSMGDAMEAGAAEMAGSPAYTEIEYAEYDIEPMETSGLEDVEDLDDQDRETSKGIMETAKEKGRQMKEKLAAGAEAARQKAAGAAASISETAHHMKEGTVRRARYVRETAADRTQRLRERTRQMGSQITHKASDAYHYTEDKFYEVTDHYPLAAGLGFLALGLIAGLALPRTRKEDEMMGETADELRARARETGQELLDRGQRAARAAVETAKQEAQAQGFTAENLSSKVSKVAGDVKQAAMESARQEGLDTQSLKQKAQQVGREVKEAAKAEAGMAANPGQNETSVAGSSTSQTGSRGCPS